MGRRKPPHFHGDRLFCAGLPRRGPRRVGFAKLKPMRPISHRGRRDRQRGYALLIVMLMLTLLVLALARAVPAWKTAIQRDRENASIEYAKQYVTGIKRYYKKFGSYPPNLDRLKSTNGLLFLRHAWTDPLTGGDYQLIHYGQAQANEIVNYYGRVNSTPTGANSATGAGSATGTGGGTTGATAGSTAGVGAAPGAQFMAGMGSMATGAAVGGFGLMGSQSAAAGGLGASPSMGAMGGLGGLAGGSEGAQGTAQGSPTGAGTGASAGAAQGSFLGLGDNSQNGQQLGGGPIIGVASTSQKPAVHEFNNFNQPNKWQFVYDPQMDQSLSIGGVGVGTTGLPGSSPNPIGTTPTIGH